MFFIIWRTFGEPPVDFKRVRTNVIRRMFAALEQCYPRGHRLHKIFNRHTIKASYRTLANMSKQIAIHNSIVIKEYNNNHITQQPRVPFPPGPPQQQPPVPAPPGPPLTRSRARAASVAPAPLVTPAPAPARALSTPSTVTLTVTPNTDTPSPAGDTQPPPLPQRVRRRQSPAAAAMAAAAACDAAFADLMLTQATPPPPPPPDQPQPLPQRANRRRAARDDTPPSTSQTLPLPSRTQNDTSTGSQNNIQVQNIDTGGQNNNNIEAEDIEPPPPLQNPAATKTCNCSKRDLETEGCPLGGFCLTPNVIYGATVRILDIFGEPIDLTKETYTGLSEPPWKTRKYGHNSDFKHKKKGTSKKGTTLSKYIWTLKDPDDCNIEPCPNKIEWTIEWKILARAKGYNPITGVCRLCLKECYFLLFKTETASLNKRGEIFTPCPHRKFKFLANAKIT